MPRFTVLHGERQEGRRENGEDADIRKYSDMLVQAGFEVAVSHVFRPVSWREGPRLREMLLGPDSKPLYANRRIWRSEETVAQPRQ